MFSLVAGVTRPAAAAELQLYVGGVGEITALTGAASSAPSDGGLSVAQYSPRNGPGVQLFAGLHLNNWISVQGNYFWRTNKVGVSSTSSTPGMYFSEMRDSSQIGGIIDALVYFRPLSSRIRPFLGVGAGILRLSSPRSNIDLLGSEATLPAAEFSSVRPVLDVPVGADLYLTRRLAFRYSFSEMRRSNDFAQQLVPRGSSALLDFQNMFGFVFQP